MSFIDHDGLTQGHSQGLTLKELGAAENRRLPHLRQAFAEYEAELRDEYIRLQKLGYAHEFFSCSQTMRDAEIYTNSLMKSQYRDPQVIIIGSLMEARKYDGPEGMIREFAALVANVARFQTNTLNGQVVRGWVETPEFKRILRARDKFEASLGVLAQEPEDLSSQVKKSPFQRLKTLFKQVSYDNAYMSLRLAKQAFKHKVARMPLTDRDMNHLVANGTLPQPREMSVDVYMRERAGRPRRIRPAQKFGRNFK